MKRSALCLSLSLLLLIHFTGVNCTNETTQLQGPDSIQSSSLIDPIFERNVQGDAGDFVAASKAVTPAVVHIKTTYASASSAYPQRGSTPSPSGSGARRGTGSGVIIDPEGFIATNNHVVENASAIEVILPDKQVFSATLVGRDPNTDLALLKVAARGLPVVNFGNSDLVEVGEWVLAIGYPFSLNTTVTAGIVSAKARSIGIINRNNGSEQNGNVGQAGSTAVESFIQTDAAINPGNSGGALVNTKGQLIGINSAIASYTGSYTGYAFAIPVNLARKILDDLRNYGAVQRGVLGVSFPAPSAEDQFMKQQGLNPATVKGVYITDVLSGSAAEASGLKEGDIIQSIDGVALSSSTEFSERVARHKPGDAVKLTYLRQGKILSGTAILEAEQETRVTANSPGSLKELYNKLGATFAPLTNEIKQRFSLNSGVVVTEVQRGGVFDRIGIPESTIIAFVNGRAVDNPNDIDNAMQSAQRGIVQILAVAPDGSKVVFNFSLGT